jgi:hypothetical protein
LVGSLVHRVGVGDVKDHPPGAAAGLLDLLGGGVQAIGVAGEQCERRSFVGEGSRRGAANSRAGRR